MKLANLTVNNSEQIGVLEDGRYLLCSDRWLGGSFPTEIGSLIGRPTMFEALLEHFEAHDLTAVKPSDVVRHRPAIEHPRKIICIGLNYRKHALESGAEVPSQPVVFGKFSDTVAAHDEEIRLPAGSNQVDYEAELAIVIGAQTFRVSEESALDNVFGYCNANDLSARDLQLRTSQWLIGKSCPQFAPIGPIVVTRDEIPDPNNLKVSAYRNQRLVQDSNTSDMIFSCASLIQYVSQFFVLEAGDLILTGTPDGVILGMPKERRSWLQPGDEFVVHIEGLGRLRNYLVETPEVR